MSQPPVLPPNERRILRQVRLQTRPHLQPDEEAPVSPGAAPGRARRRLGFDRNRPVDRRAPQPPDL